MASRPPRGPRLPRFLPPDPRVEQPYLFTPKTAFRVAILGAVALVVFGVLFLRLWSLQVLAANKYRKEAETNQVRTVSLEAPRGPILDSRGRVLVTNTVSKAVVVLPSDLPTGDTLRDELWQLHKVLSMPVVEIKKLIREHRADGPVTPVTLRVAVHPEQEMYIAEHASQFRGVQIKQTFLRTYTAGDALAQTLGYVGRIDAEQYKRFRKDQDYKRKNLQNDDRIGQAGVEAAFDKYLHGTNGVAEVRVNSVGHPVGRPLSRTLPQPGNAVRLTIDIGLQRAAEQALQYGINLAVQSTKDGWAANGGALVAMDVNTGAILALASNPTYKPRVWVNRDPKDLKQLLDPKAAKAANYPTLNRALDVTYPPGSTFKPVTALAALDERIVSPYQTLACTGSYTVRTIYGAPQTFKNWTPYVNQQMDLPTAIEQSCDTYFYELGWRFYNLPTNRGQPLQRWARDRFGFGETTGIDIGPEASGLVPTIDWKHKTFTKKTDPCCWEIDRLWKPGDSIQLAIGQKDVLVTPLQLARFYSLLANGGKLVTPHVVQDVELPSPSGKGVPTVQQSFQPPTPKVSGVDPSYLAAVRDGLYRAAHNPLGTSSSTFASFPVPVAGKTGTAEKVVTLPDGRQLTLNQSLWCGYAPAEHPTIAVCAVIENGGHGSESAAPAAARVLAQYFHQPVPQTTLRTAD